jgi:hypothetical protein
VSERQRSAIASGTGAFSFKKQWRKGFMPSLGATSLADET